MAREECLICGYQRRDEDAGPDYECPKCCAVYAKVKAALERDSGIEGRRDKRPHRPGRPVVGPDAPVWQQFLAAPLWQRIFVAVIFAVGTPLLIFDLVGGEGPFGSPFNRPYDMSFTVNENIFGVKFYYFRGKRAPRLEPSADGIGLNRLQLASLKESIPGLQNLDTHGSLRRIRETVYVQDGVNGASVTVELRECPGGYSCLKRVVDVPTDREKTVVQSRNSSGKLVFVSREEYGKEWPYLFNFGQLACRNYNEVVIIADHKEYAVNGTAMSAKSPSGEKRWQDDWVVRKPLPHAPGGRMPTPRDFIQRGLGLCD